MPVSPGTYNYYLAPWVWHDTPEMQWWGAPVGMVANVDLRPLPAQAMAGGTPEGFSFLAMHPAADAPEGSLYLGNDLNATLSDAVKRDAEARLGLSAGDFALQTVLDNGWLTLTDLADPTGDNRTKPLMPTIAGNLELHLAGHSLIKTERFDKVRHPWVSTMVQRDFGHRAKDDPDVLRLLRRKYGFTTLEILGAAAFPPVRGGLSNTESFNTADSDTLGPDLTWTEVSGDWDIASNQATTPIGSQDNIARADSDLAGDDMYTQVDWVQGPATSTWAGVLVRFSSSVFTAYLGLWRNSNQWEAWKVINGSFTQLGSDLGANGAPTSTIKTQADGSTVTVYSDGVLQGTRTDSAITGNTRGGIGTVSANVIFDSFEAADLAAGEVAVHGTIFKSTIFKGGPLRVG